MDQHLDDFLLSVELDKALENDLLNGDVDDDTDIEISPQYPENLTNLLQQAILDRATDVHIDPFGDKMAIRFRIDGIVHTKQKLAMAEGQRLLNQVKVAAKIDIEKHFVPVESQMRWLTEMGARDIRIVITPAGQRDAAHMRFMTTPEQFTSPESLGFSDQQQQQIRNAMKAQHGLVLVSGSTGAGKSSSLYALASMLELEKKIGVSIEDPIEHDMDHLRQIQVDEDHGLTMYEGLRVVLRMDPDVIIVGEIRDEHSAMIAARAAMAGRLVIATLHSTDSASAVETMHYLGVPYYVLGSTLRMIISQSLVRKLCMNCSTGRKLTQQETELFEHYNMAVPDQVYNSVGCNECGGYGHTDRLGVFEIATIGKDVSKMITHGTSHELIRDTFRSNGVKPVIVDALSKAAMGMASMEEVYQACWLDIAAIEEDKLQKNSDSDLVYNDSYTEELEYTD
ncbi:MAG: Flp pilus assembly complex ATPase component TadA [Phycisphaerae bacterium]|nr:Flp pilus assembly complex ATPase component TadA [Phycisphaerae bacterium]